LDFMAFPVIIIASAPRAYAEQWRRKSTTRIWEL
jgi:hypothetical protein